MCSFIPLFYLCVYNAVQHVDVHIESESYALFPSRQLPVCDGTCSMFIKWHPTRLLFLCCCEAIPDRREPYRRAPLGRVHLDERQLDEVQ